MPRISLIAVISAIVVMHSPCLQAQTGQIEAWVTLPDRSVLFEKQTETIAFSDRNSGRGGPAIVIDEGQPMQTIDGFGFALTGGSVELLMKMNPADRSKVLREVFAADGSNIGVSYLRLTIGASDLNSFVFSYNDLNEGETDYGLEKFSLSRDLKDVIPVMKEILAIDPGIKLLGSPWSAPAWMKTNNNVRGGQLKKECYGVYALYFVKYIQAMKEQGITIDAITIQNEPLNSRNTPSMFWFEDEQADFIKNHLGPALEKAGLPVKIILFDHNCDRPDYPLAMLSDPEVARYADGSGFHHYAGDFGALSLVHMARPDKNIYFTEQMVVERPGSPAIDISAQVKRLIIGAGRNWSRNVILWNLAADPLNDPHTDNGGCSMCQGAITIDGNTVTRNIAWYTIAHASKFVRPGSVRIASTDRGDKTVALYEDEQRPGAFRAALIENTIVLPNVAFKTPEGRIVLIIVNDTFSTGSFTVQYKGRFATISLPPGAAGTYIWHS
ncbi:MAG: glycoside hydrolase family 30 beta sandwich domain-containing protein [Bacteroidales bacterium]|jgi:glucosylceramidase|nr:glycoside hydrolase family 30 beta sandwich domain-containing protein [Bacteroidales bacterium]